MTFHSDEHDNTDLHIDVGTTNLDSDYPVGLEPVASHIEQVSYQEGRVVERLRAAASLRMEVNHLPLEGAEKVKDVLGIDGELVAAITIGEDTEFLLVRLLPSSDSTSLEGVDEHSRYLIIGERAQVWLNLNTQGLASPRTKPAVLADMCVLAPGEACQIGRVNYGDAVGLKMLRPYKDDSKVSRKHARIVCLDDGGLVISDMYSRNGVQVCRQYEV